jgi:ubiquinone/menaquinone biosynthesis C-methylase UbiE
VEFWDRRAGRADLYPVLTGRWSPAQCVEADREQRRALGAHLPALSGRDVLDLGCGIGRLTGWLAGSDAGGAAARVIGVDYSGAMLARAASQVQLGNVDFVCACAQHLPFQAGAFDVVVTTAVLQHLTVDEEFRRACAQATRVLRPGGVLVCLEGIVDPAGSGPAGPDPAGAAAGSATATIRRSLTQLTDALAPSLVLDGFRPVRCVEDEYVVSRWTRPAEVDRW